MRSRAIVCSIRFFPLFSFVIKLFFGFISVFLTGSARFELLTLVDLTGELLRFLFMIWFTRKCLKRKRKGK